MQSGNQIDRAPVSVAQASSLYRASTVPKLAKAGSFVLMVKNTRSSRLEVLRGEDFDLRSSTNRENKKEQAGTADLLSTLPIN